MSAIILNRTDLLSFVKRARCPLDPSIFSLFLSFQNDLITALTDLSSSSVQICGHLNPNPLHIDSNPSHESASALPNFQPSYAAPSQYSTSSASDATSTSTSPSSLAVANTTVNGISSDWTPSLAGNNNSVLLPHGTAQVPPPPVSSAPSLTDISMSNSAVYPPWTDHNINIDVGPILPFLSPFSDRIAPRLDGDDDPFDWTIVLEIVACRPAGFMVCSLWRTFKTVYLQLPPSRQKTAWRVLMQRYKSRYRGSALASELSTVVHFENCLVPSGGGSYQAGIRIPFTKTPYHLFRQEPKRWRDDTHTFE